MLEHPREILRREGIRRRSVRGRNSDNRLIMERLSWQPSLPLRAGLEKTYAWIESQVMANR